MHPNLNSITVVSSLQKKVEVATAVEEESFALITACDLKLLKRHFSHNS